MSGSSDDASEVRGAVPVVLHRGEGGFGEHAMLTNFVVAFSPAKINGDHATIRVHARRYMESAPHALSLRRLAGIWRVTQDSVPP